MRQKEGRRADLGRLAMATARLVPDVSGKKASHRGSETRRIPSNTNSSLRSWIIQERRDWNWLIQGLLHDGFFTFSSIQFPTEGRFRTAENSFVSWCLCVRLSLFLPSPHRFRHRARNRTTPDPGVLFVVLVGLSNLPDEIAGHRPRLRRRLHALRPLVRSPIDHSSYPGYNAGISHDGVIHETPAFRGENAASVPEVC